MGFKQNLLAQFKRPHGYLGSLAGFIMANRPSNIERNKWTLDLLELKLTDRVLEIGFGPGVGIECAAEIVTEGQVVGIDYSETMLHQASKRNARAIAEGRVQLHLASVDALPDFPNFNGPFDKIFSANVFQFWNDPVTTFKALGQRLAQNGVIATTYMPRRRGATNADTRKKADEIVDCLKQAGFTSIKVEEKPMKPVSAMCVLASNNEECLI